MSTFVAGRRSKGLAGGIALALGLGMGLTSGALAQHDAQSPPPPPAPAMVAHAAGKAESAGVVGERVWKNTRGGLNDQVLSDLRAFPEGAAGSAALKKNVASLETNIAKREETRSAKFKEAKDKMEAELAKNSTKGLSEALKRTLEMYLLTPERDRDAFKREAWVKEMVTKCDAAARECESKGDLFTANELFFRLNALMEEEGTYRADQKRMGQRLTMIRLYIPQRFWQLRNDERLEAGKPALPPYNDLGEKYEEKINGISRAIVFQAIVAAANQHIDRETSPSELLVQGLESVRTMVTTTDLEGVFEGIKNPAARDAMNAAIDQRIAKLRTSKSPISRTDITDIFEELSQVSKTTVGIPENALLHEFGNGAMSKLDEFSAIVWPDEVTRFDRMTQGNFIGVGIQIQIDEESQLIKVVTPIEGTPAQRGGIRSGDLIKKINGNSAVGISLNQAVDQITGAADTKVNLTMERPGDLVGKDNNELPREIDFNLTRTRIPIYTVKGWRRTGAHEADWDWFVDQQNRIGYVRLTQFTESTTDALRKAIDTMKASGPLGGLILDLRFNPGGLLTEAVSVSNVFIDSGAIVSTRGTVNQGGTQSATPGNAMLGGAPLVVLINEGSASASEIVSGAVRVYSDKGDIDAAILGQRSFGKGSVQNVFPLSQNAKMKLTTQYYYLPDGKLIHRKPGATQWGVDPHMKVEDLAENQSDGLKLRQDADVLPLDEHGRIVDTKVPRPDPQKLLDDGLDLQLQQALAILQAKSLAKGEKNQAQIPENTTRPTQ
jgi:carboxyl-terminal processing protease